MFVKKILHFNFEGKNANFKLKNLHKTKLEGNGHLFTIFKSFIYILLFQMRKKTIHLKMFLLTVRMHAYTRTLVVCSYQTATQKQLQTYTLIRKFYSFSCQIINVIFLRLLGWDRIYRKINKVMKKSDME